jgi:hypothetical protein
MSDDDPHRLLGAYVFGGLASTDRATFENHLAACRRCTAELAASAGIPALLRRAEPTPVSIPDPAEFVHLVAAARSRGRRRRRRVVVSVTGALIIAAVAVGFVELGTPAPRADADFTAVGAGRVSGSAVFEAKPWGTQIELDLASLPHRGTFTLEVRGRDGTVERAATWSGTSQPHTRVTAATSLTSQNIGELEIVRVGAVGPPIARAARAT